MQQVGLLEVRVTRQLIISLLNHLLLQVGLVVMIILGGGCKLDADAASVGGGC